MIKLYRFRRKIIFKNNELKMSKNNKKIKIKLVY